MPAYNNYFPTNYQPMYPGAYQQPAQQIQQYQQQPQMQMPVQQPMQRQNSNAGVNWVQGEAGAKSWLIAPNETVMLMDSEADVFYLKSADASGVPLPLRIFDYKERRSDASKADLANSNGKSIDYATKDDLNELQKATHDSINELRKQLKDELTDMFSGGTVSFTTKSKKKEASNE